MLCAALSASARPALLRPRGAAQPATTHRTASFPAAAAAGRASRCAAPLAADIHMLRSYSSRRTSVRVAASAEEPAASSSSSPDVRSSEQQQVCRGSSRCLLVLRIWWANVAEAYEVHVVYSLPFPLLGRHPAPVPLRALTCDPTPLSPGFPSLLCCPRRSGAAPGTHALFSAAASRRRPTCRSPAAVSFGRRCDGRSVVCGGWRGGRPPGGCARPAGAGGGGHADVGAAAAAEGAAAGDWRGEWVWLAWSVVGKLTASVEVEGGC